MKIFTISKNGLDLIKKFEGFKEESYLCPSNVWTIGYGNTYWLDGSKVKKGEKITEEKASELLKKTIHFFEKEVDSYTTDSLNQNQFDSLVSFTYNVGNQNFKTSTLLKLINLDLNDKKIYNEFLKWNKGNNKVLEGLKIRRKIEADLYFS